MFYVSMSFFLSGLLMFHHEYILGIDLSAHSFPFLGGYSFIFSSEKSKSF